MSASRGFEIGLFTFGEITADPVTGRVDHDLAKSAKQPANEPLTRAFNGADDGIRTRDPHLGNVKRTVRLVRPTR
jgi:hypothetical protein